MKKILGSIKNIFRIFIKGFYFLCSILAKGFFFYPKKFFMFLKKIFKNSSRLDKIIKHFEKRQLQSQHYLPKQDYYSVPEQDYYSVPEQD